MKYVTRNDVVEMVRSIVGPSNVEHVQSGHDADGNLYVSFAMGIRRYKITAKKSYLAGAVESIQIQLREFRGAFDFIENHRTF